MSRHPIETLWREVGLPEYFLGNDGGNDKLYALYDRITEKCAKVAEGTAPIAPGNFFSARRDQCAKIAAKIRALSFPSGEGNGK